MISDQRLPVAARHKIFQIESAIDDSDTAARGALVAASNNEARKAALQNVATASPNKAAEAEEEIALLDREIDRLRDVARARSAWAASNKQVMARIRDLLAKLPRDAVFEAAPSVRLPERFAGLTPPVAIETVRDEIADLEQELSDVRAAPLPISELRVTVEEVVARLQERGRPTLNIERGLCEIGWRKPGATIPGSTPEDVAAFFAWLDPDSMRSALTREIEATAGDGGKLDSQQRVAREAEIVISILELERIEEALIEATPEIARRSEANPLAVLAVRFAQGGAARAA